MSQTSNFLDKYFGAYLRRCRLKNEGRIPPNDRELENLLSYLEEKGGDPIIMGALAFIKHFKPNKGELEDSGFFHTQDIDLLVSGKLPDPPFGWRCDTKPNPKSISLSIIPLSKNSYTIGAISELTWISPTGGYVNFFREGQRLGSIFLTRATLQNTFYNTIEKDPESLKKGCPVLSLLSLFLIQLSFATEMGFSDLLALARKVGIPRDLSRKSLNHIQRDNLHFIKHLI